MPQSTKRHLRGTPLRYPQYIGFKHHASSLQTAFSANFVNSPKICKQSIVCGRPPKRIKFPFRQGSPEGDGSPLWSFDGFGRIETPKTFASFGYKRREKI